MTDQPLTRASIATSLARLGLDTDDIVLVHSSLKSLGWVCGGAVAVVQALLDVVGTLVVPTHTTGNSDPKEWSRPPVPAFDTAITPSDGIGVIPEVVRTWPGAVRGNHPHTSFAAIGPAAAELMAGHALDCQLGGRSPSRRRLVPRRRRSIQ